MHWGTLRLKLTGNKESHSGSMKVKHLGYQESVMECFDSKYISGEEFNDFGPLNQCIIKLTF